MDKGLLIFETMLELSEDWLEFNGYIIQAQYCEESDKIAFDAETCIDMYMGKIDTLDWRLSSYAEIDAFRYAVAEDLVGGEE